MVVGRGKLPFRRRLSATSVEDALEFETLLMDFALWLAVCRPSGRPISAKTIMKYIGQVLRWHRRHFSVELMGDNDRRQLHDIMKGICATVKQPPPLRRWGARTQDLAKALEIGLDPTVPEDAMWRAACTMGFTGLMRAAEFALQSGQAWDPEMHLTRADVKVYTRSDGSRYLILTFRPAKRRGQRKVVPLLLGGGGSLLDPVAAYEAMVAADPVPARELATTPLFRRANGSAIKVAEVRGMVKLLMSSLGLDPARFGAHSLRIGGASAALAAGMGPAAIRAAGRWSSDIYELYCRLSRESAAHVSVVIGSTPFADLERGVEFCDEELMLTTEELPYGVVDDFVGRDLIDDALASDGEEY